MSFFDVDCASGLPPLRDLLHPDTRRSPARSPRSHRRIRGPGSFNESGLVQRCIPVLCVRLFGHAGIVDSRLPPLPFPPPSPLPRPVVGQGLHARPRVVLDDWLPA